MIYDKKEALKEVRRTRPDYDYIAPELWADKSLAAAAVKAHVEAYKYISKELQMDNDIINAVLPKLGGYNQTLKFTDFPEALQNDKDFVRKALTADAKIYKQISDKFKGDKDLALLAVQSEGYCYYFVPSALKEDKEIALAAVNSVPDAYKYFPDKVKRDKDVACIVAGKLPKAELDKHAFPKYLYKDIDIAMQVLRNKHIQDPMSLLPSSLFSKQDNIIAFLQEGLNPNLFSRFIPREITSNKDFALEAIKINPEIYNHLDLTLRVDKEIAALTVEIDEDMIKYVPAGCLDDRKDLALKIVEKDGTMISQDALKSFQDDSEVAMTAILNDGHAYNYISKRLQKNEAIMLATISDNIACFVFTKNPELCNNKEFMLKAIEMNEETLRYASKALRDDRDFALSVQPHITGKSAPMQNPFGRFSADRDFVLEAVKANPESIKYAADSLKYDRDFIQQAIKVSPRVKLFCEPEMAKPSKEHFMEEMKKHEKPSRLEAAMSGAKKKLEERKAAQRLEERDDGAR